MKQIYALLTLIFTVTFVISPAFTSPFSGFRADQLPIPQPAPPVQPAGYAFSIWGLIYGWLLVSALFGMWKRRDAADWNAARPALIISLAVGTPWLAVANANAIAATLMIFVMGLAAIMALIYAPARDRWLFQAPVGIYAGWLTAASFVSLGSTGAGYGVPWGSLNWAYVSIVAALIVAIAVQWQRRNAPEYGLTIIWALVGIVISNMGDPLSVTLLAIIGIVLMAGTAFQFYRTRSSDPSVAPS